jgi:hypothetical protein
MPLIKSKSKSALSHNIMAEEQAGKPKAQSLAIALSVKDKAKKKMAQGGIVSAKEEFRPMPGNEPSMAKASPPSFVSEKRPMAPARPKMEPLSRPKIASSGAFKVRDMADLMKLDHEEDHSIEDLPPEAPAEIEAEEAELEKHPMTSMGINDKSKPHSKNLMMAEGGEVSDEMDQPEEEEAIEHAASIAAAIMAKRAAKKMMAEGGMVELDGHEDESELNDQNKAALKENYDEGMEGADDPMESNEHSPEHAEEDVDDSDIVAAIRRKMKMKSMMTK